MFDIENDSSMRRLCYIAAWLLFLVPLLTALGAVWPLGFNNVRWRLSATNTVGQNLLLPFVAMVMILGIALSNGQRGVARFVSVFSMLTAVGIVLAIGLFTLDSIQLKAIVRTNEMEAYNNAIVRVGASLGIYLFAYGALAFYSARALRSQQKSSPKNTKKVPMPDEAPGFLIGQDYTK